MSGEVVEYVHLPSGLALPSLLAKPRRIMVLIEQNVAPEWQDAVSKRIIESGCLYMMAWGQNCSSWDDSVDHANLEKFDYGDVPEEDFVMTTWHENEALCEVFFFARVCAFHPTIALPVLTILDIREEPRSLQFSLFTRRRDAVCLKTFLKTHAVYRCASDLRSC